MERFIDTTIFFLLFLFLTTSLVFSQSQVQSHEGVPIRFSVDLVVLHAQVLKIGTGEVVGSLQRDDFILYEDGVRQRITHFSQDRLPLSIVLLVDVSRSVYRDLQQIRVSALQALSLLKAEDEVALINFATDAALIQSFTRDKGLVADKIGKVDVEYTVLNPRNRSDGTHIGDSIYEAATYLTRAANPDGRRVILVVTDDQPWESWLRHSKKEVTDHLFETGSIVYGLIVQGYVSPLEKASPVFLKRWLTHLFVNGGTVKTYAEKTGGVVIDAQKRDLEARLTQMMEILRKRYDFGYVPSNQKWDGKFRKIKLEVSREVKKRVGEVAIITRKGYYARKRTGTANASPEKPTAKP